MRKENTIIIGIAAVVIVACLLVSWVYIDDGDTGDLAVRSEASVGDFAELHVTVYGDSPSEYDVRYNVVSIENGETTIEVVREDGVTEYIASDLVIEYPEGKSVGTGILTLDRFGDVECEIYQIPRGEGESYVTELWVEPDSGFVLAAEYIFDDGSSQFLQITDSSLFDPEPPVYGSQELSFELEAGDYSAALQTHTFPNGLELTGIDYYVLSSVDGDTCYSGWTGDTPTAETRAEYISVFYIDDYSGYELSGQALVHSPGYGDVLCDVLVSEYDGALQKHYVGPSDGIIYRQSLEYPNGYSVTLDIVFSTHIGEGIDRPVYQERLGDRITVGVFDDSEFLYEYSQTIVAIEDGMYTVADTLVGYTEYRQNDFGLFYDTEEFEFKVIHGTGFMEVLDFGVLPYLLVYDDRSTLDRMVYSIYVPLLELDVGYVYEYYDGSVDYTLITETTVYDDVPEFDSNDVSAEVSVDTRFDYAIETTYPDGDVETVFDSWVVDSMEADGTLTFGWEGIAEWSTGTADDYLSQVILGSYPDDIVSGQTVFVDSEYGTILCDVIEADYDDGTTSEILVGVDDGVVYRLTYSYPDGSLEVQTLLFSTNVGDGITAPAWELRVGTYFDVFLAMMTEDGQFLNREVRVTVVELVDGVATLEYENAEGTLEQITIDDFLIGSYGDHEVILNDVKDVLGSGEHNTVSLSVPVPEDAGYTLQVFYMPYLDLTYGFMLLQDHGSSIYVTVNGSNLFETDSGALA